MQQPNNEPVEKVSGQVENTKFVYKKSGLDLGVVMIFIFTILAFAAIYFISTHYDGRQAGNRTIEEESRYRELIQQRNELQAELYQYQQDADLNRDN